MASSGAPAQLANADNGKILVLRPVMPGGADLFTDASQLARGVASRSENLDLSHKTMERRRGKKNLVRFITPNTTGASKTFGTTGKYATFTPPLIPVGGFVVIAHFKATDPSSTPAAYVVGARPTGQTFHVFRVMIQVVATVSTLTVSWRDSAGATHSIVAAIDETPAISNLMAIYDAVAGTFKVYVNGSQNGSTISGLSATLKPDQTAGVVWTFGIEKETGQAVTADTQYLGAIAGMTILSLRGLSAGSGSGSLFESLRRNSARTWPSPFMDNVLAHYDMDEASGSTMYDRSSYKNHGAYVGSPTVSSALLPVAAPINMITSIEVPAGGYNLVHCFGTLQIEQISPAAV